MPFVFPFISLVRPWPYSAQSLIKGPPPNQCPLEQLPLTATTQLINLHGPFSVGGGPSVERVTQKK